MDQSIAALLQIHYHFRVGGVREVIRGYSRSYSAIYGSDRFNALVCNCDSSPCGDTDLEIIDVPECDYLDFTDKGKYCHSRDLLINKIDAVLDRMPQPAVILCHNMALGKNPALSSALRVLAQRKGGQKYRFFWVIHDLAEEGRIDMLDKIADFERSGVAVRDDLYAAGAPVHFLTPGNNIYAALEKAGFPVTCLPNPMIPDDIGDEFINRDILLDNLKVVAESDGFTFDPQRPLFYYPARIIRRKNVLEAVCLASVLFDGNLILGVPGTSHADRILYHKLANFVKEAGLRVVIDPTRLHWKSITGNDRCCDNPAPYLYKLCDLALSTSLSEGFGYALFEPWIYNRAVLARRPAGFLYPEGIDSSLLYERLPVLLEWVCWKDLKEKYYQFYSRFMGSGLPNLEAECCMINEECVDFGILDTDTQIKILKKAGSDQTARERMGALFKKISVPWWGLNAIDSIDKTLIGKNRGIILDLFSNQRFRWSFQECISRIPQVSDQGFGYEKVQQELWKRGFKLFFSGSGGYNENITK